MSGGPRERMADARRVNERLAEASTRIADARRVLAEGRAVDLGDLGERVDAACRDLVGLPAAEAREFQPRLMALYDDINGLAETLKREHDALKRTLGDLDARQRAQSAYQKSAHNSD